MTVSTALMWTVVAMWWMWAGAVWFGWLADLFDWLEHQIGVWAGTEMPAFIVWYGLVLLLMVDVTVGIGVCVIVLMVWSGFRRLTVLVERRVAVSAAVVAAKLVDDRIGGLRVDLREAFAVLDSTIAGVVDDILDPPA